MIADALTPDEPVDARLADSGLFDATGVGEVPNVCERCGEPAPTERLYCGDACHAAALADMFGEGHQAAQDRPCGCKGGDPLPMDPEAQIRDLWAAVGECQLRVIDRGDRRDTLAEILTVVLVGFAIGLAVDIVRGGAVIDTTGRG